MARIKKENKETKTMIHAAKNVGKKETHLLLVGLKTDTVTLDISQKIFKKAKRSTVLLIPQHMYKMLDVSLTLVTPFTVPRKNNPE